jgi:hypothetical protein
MPNSTLHFSQLHLHQGLPQGPSRNASQNLVRDLSQTTVDVVFICFALIDGGQEVISARFLHPDDALEEFHSGKITFMPPQAYILTTLAGILQGRANTPAQRARVQELSAGMFGRMVINPRRLLVEDEEGRTILTYEGDETRGGSKGRLHRALVKVGQSGVSSLRNPSVPCLINKASLQITSEIKLQRNFDIFTQIEPQAFAVSSKL